MVHVRRVEYGSCQTTGECRFVIGFAETAYGESYQVQSVGHLIRGGASGCLVSPNATRRNAEQPGKQLRAEYFGQAVLYELWCRRLFECCIEVLQYTLKS